LPAFNITLNRRVKPQCVLWNGTPVDACRTFFEESSTQFVSRVVANNVPVQPKLVNAPSWLDVSMSGTTMSFLGRQPEGSAGVYDTKVDYRDGVPQNVHGKQSTGILKMFWRPFIRCRLSPDGRRPGP
jgi:hypothetical protein